MLLFNIKKITFFIFISTSETALPFSCTHLYTKPLYPRSGKPDSWGSRQSLDVANLILKQLNLQRMLAKLLECQVLQMTSYGPQYAPGHPGYPAAHWESIFCFGEDHSRQVLPAYKDPEQMRTDQMASQSTFLHKGQMWLLVPLPKVSTMLRHIELQFHQRKLRNTRMTAYPPFPLAEWTHPYLSIYFKGKIMPNYTSQSQVCFSETKYTLISKILPSTHRHFLSEILTPSKLI